MKIRKIAAAVCAAVIMGTMGTLSAWAGNVIYGDVDLNGEINVTDVVKIAAHVKSIKPLVGEELRAADVNGDGNVDITDVVMVAAHVKNIKPIVQRKN
ncbi:dockerin type I repeat-containing protein [Ruminococcus sp.]|uniref:dockerin type I repeat-containing protein n=1 Tax=Ruminococcus sp. TaxID=41978 RepID=UPI0025E04898|nr:dockerin type I repeat-containing protein [Ruminococcus sp.]MBQ8966619.1 dockerin type I repeat-containing protein [Ruminococcus sp.]